MATLTLSRHGVPTVWLVWSRRIAPTSARTGQGAAVRVLAVPLSSCPRSFRVIFQPGLVCLLRYKYGREPTDAELARYARLTKAAAGDELPRGVPRDDARGEVLHRHPRPDDAVRRWRAQDHGQWRVKRSGRSAPVRLLSVGVCGEAPRQKVPGSSAGWSCLVIFVYFSWRDA